MENLDEFQVYPSSDVLRKCISSFAYTMIPEDCDYYEKMVGYKEFAIDRNFEFALWDFKPKLICENDTFSLLTSLDTVKTNVTDLKAFLDIDYVFSGSHENELNVFEDYPDVPTFRTMFKQHMENEGVLIKDCFVSIRTEQQNMEITICFDLK